MAVADLIESLATHDVEFIVVGGAAASLQGAPVDASDLAIVYARSRANLDRLLELLKELGAVYRDDPRKVRPNRSHLEGAGHKMLETRQGPLDLFGIIEENTTFESLLGDAEWLDLNGSQVRVLSLSRQIRVKERLDRPKDQAILAVLRATLEEKRLQPKA
jgi:predicted nucleotidyltransferase